MKMAIKSLEKSHQENPYLDFFFTPLKEQFSHATVPDLIFYDETLNDAQKNAIHFGLTASPVGLIHGK